MVEHRIMLGEVKRHLAHKGMRSRYTKLYRAAMDLANECKNPKVWELVCEATDVGSRGGLYGYYGNPPKSEAVCK